MRFPPRTRSGLCVAIFYGVYPYICTIAFINSCLLNPFHEFGCINTYRSKRDTKIQAHFPCVPHPQITLPMRTTSPNCVPHRGINSFCAFCTHVSDVSQQEKLQVANVKLGRAIAKAKSSLVAECKNILDSTLGGMSSGSQPLLSNGQIN